MDRQKKSEKYLKLETKRKELYILYQNKPNWFNRYRLRRIQNKLLKIERSIGRYYRPLGNYYPDYNFDLICK